ncbi:chorismate synthase [Candidatus Neptunichlamydia sp. REUL1]|uniref:chorismate synthase n=1 Tax=Candidatus Neptunichlamydia sp. REUL1 TaxID=3064277 RepID=UPI002931A9E6|nr:chorismate synthase [Candidatus Neptunochlamydia sp. REUL1]
MASNSFGQLFRVTTWGESHGKGIGAIIDGCPAGIPITDDEINEELERRVGGKTPYTTPRLEKDKAEIFSGVFEGKTTGAPISIIIFNKDADPSKYEPIKDLMRPGHANFTYLEKYGIFDYRGGGRSSARETACRVAAGTIAKKLLALSDIHITAYIHSIGGISINSVNFGAIPSSPIFCPDLEAGSQMMETILKAKEEHDSLGGVIECTTTGLPIGLGDPVYEKLEANLAKGMLSIPATKGFEIGEGFNAANLKGSEHNDGFTTDASGSIVPTTNHAGGTLGGISTGLPLTFRVAFKPTSSIEKSQKTVDTSGKAQTFQLPAGSRHDPCVTIRAVPIVEAMAACVYADSLLLSLSSKC